MCQSEIILRNQGTGYRKWSRCHNFMMKYRWGKTMVVDPVINELYEKDAIKAGWRFKDGKWLCPACAAELKERRPYEQAPTN